MMKMATVFLLFLFGGCASTKPSPEQPPVTQSAQMQVVPLKHAPAPEIAAELGRLLRHVRIVADQRTNSLIVSAETAAELSQVLELIEDLDVEITTQHVTTPS